jgi:class 3 adenylate cyclase/tetratricopeptide (TPR) repeat protein
MACGFALGAVPAPVTTPRHLAEKILGSRAAVEGERKQVTVMFADMKGSLEAIAARDPEDARTVLDPVLARMIEAVHRYEGTVNQVMGDGIMALFGAPVAHEDHAVRACYAALRMQAALAALAVELRRTHAVEPRIRVGLNSGEVVVRAIGNDLSLDYSAIGLTTHLAARMEGLAAPGTIVATADTARLAEGWVQMRALGPVAVKGLARPVAVWEVTGRGPVRTRLALAAARGLSRFVGREREQAALARARDEVAAGRGQVVALVGEPGVGKSRLAWEFAQAARAAGWLVLEATASTWTRGTPYAPVVELIRAYLGVEDSDPPAVVGDKVIFGLPADHPAALIAPLLALLDAPLAPADDAGWPELDGDARRRRTIRAVRHLLVARPDRQPACLLIEDLQDVDADTLAVLDGLVIGATAAPVLVLVTYRPEHQHAWPAAARVGELRVDPLAPADAHALVTDLVGDAASAGPLSPLLLERTEGNPFFIEESVRHLVESGVLTGPPGAYRMARPPAATHLPETVRSVLAARIDRLEPGDKHVLEAASAVGRDVPRRLLEALGVAPPAAVGPVLARLQDAEFLTETRPPPEAQYTFRHALTLEVAYAGLVRERRRALDAAIVTALEARPDRSVEHVTRLAHHAWRGELWDKACRYGREAGRQALARSAHRAAAAAFEQALEALAALPETRERLEAGVDLRLDLRSALGPLAEYRRMLACLIDAEALAARLGDPRRQGLVAAFLLNYHTLRGDLGRAAEYGARATALGEAAGDRGLRVLADAVFALVHWARGDFRRAVERAGVTLERLAGVDERERFGIMHLPGVYTRTVMVWSLAELGEFAAAEGLAAEAQALAARHNHAPSRIFAALGGGTLALRRGAPETAVAVLEEARALSETAELPALFLELAGTLASAYCEAGRAADAIALLEEAIGRAIALRHRIGHLLRGGGLGEAYLAAGRAEEALPLAQIHVEITRTTGARGVHAWALRLAGEVALAQDPPDVAAAARALEGALALARELGMLPLQGRALLVLARARHAGGDAGGAREALAGAEALFRRLDQPRWLERAAAVRRTLVA